MKWFTEDTSNRCCNGGTQHNFQPRYDEKERDTNGLSIKNIDTAEDLRRIITIYTYIKDVCTWCGKEVPR
jgi:hypothetical protein